MDHRCLYGHRVPAAFTFAIHSHSCPTCGAPTVTVTGYQAARKLTTEVGLDAVAAFSVIRVLEADWVLTPVAADATAAPTPGAALVEGASEPATEEEVVVVDDVVEAAQAPVAPSVAAVSAPATAASDPVKADEPVRTPPRPLSRPESRTPAPAAEAAPVAATPVADVPTAGGFENAEEDFFQRT